MPSPSVSQAPGGSAWISFFFSLTSQQTFFIWVLEPGGKRSRPVPEASHTLLPVGKEGEFLHPSFPSALFQLPIRKA